MIFDSFNLESVLMLLSHPSRFLPSFFVSLTEDKDNYVSSSDTPFTRHYYCFLCCCCLSHRVAEEENRHRRRERSREKEEEGREKKSITSTSTVSIAVIHFDWDKIEEASLESRTKFASLYLTTARQTDRKGRSMNSRNRP